MMKRTRELHQAVADKCAAVGAVVTDTTTDGAGHVRFTIKRRNGSTFVCAFSFSPSDMRSRLNEMARLRRQLNSPGISRERRNIANEIGR